MNHACATFCIHVPLSGLLSATKAMGDAYGALREHGTLRDRLDTVTGFDEFGDLIGLPRHYALEAAYRGDGDSSTA